MSADAKLPPGSLAEQIGSAQRQLADTPERYKTGAADNGGVDVEAIRAKTFTHADLQSLDGQIEWCVANLHRLPLVGILTNLQLLADMRTIASKVHP